MSAQRGSVPVPFHPTGDAPPATLVRRFGAGLVDVLLLAAASAVGLLGDRRALTAVAGLLVLVLVVVQWLLHGRLGWTVGRRVTGIRTLDVETRRPIGAARVLLRGLVLAAGLLALGVGLLLVLVSPLFDRTGRNRGWHDLAARDEVL
ncbi:RDD family protein, partial [Cellulomonas sp. ICMP 17802]|uniref:RDD family protein n=1 Tax=Cellulomonas sp. ICMP 17802 TaxID=3239199 RepID=UPI00351B55C1